MNLPVTTQMSAQPAARGRRIRPAALLREARLGVRTWLFALTLAAAVPLLLFAGLVLHRLSSTERIALLNELDQRTRGATATVERHLRSIQELAVTLSRDPNALKSDLSEFYALARRVVTANSRGRSVLLVDRDGLQLLNTRQPFASLLPKYGNPAHLQATLARKVPVVSDLFVGQIVGTDLFSVAAPVFRDGAVVSVVTIGIHPAELTEVLREEHLPQDWIGGLVDSRGMIVARTHNAEALVGRMASKPLLDARTTGQRGNFSDLTTDEVRMTSSFSNLPSAGWTVVVGLPTSQLEAPLQSTQSTMLVLGLAALLIAGGLAFLVGRFMHEQVEAVSRAASAVGDGRSPTTPLTMVRELDEVNSALSSASALIDAREVAVRESEARWRFALEATRLGAWELNLKDYGSWRSLRHDQIFGYQELLPKWTYRMFFEHVHDEDRAEVALSLKTALAERRDWSFECRIRRIDGQARWIRAQGKYISEAYGIADRMFGLVEDITERKRREHLMAFLEDLQEAFAPLSSSDEVMRVTTEFVANHLGLAHCLVAQVDEAQNLCRVVYDHHAPERTSLLGEYRISDFHTEAERAELAAGRTIIIDDVSRDPRQAEKSNTSQP